MAIDVNPRADLSEDDKDVLRRVYEARLAELQEELRPLAERRDDLQERSRQITADLMAALMAAARIEGKLDELRRLAAKDGITLD